MRQATLTADFDPLPTLNRGTLGRQGARGLVLRVPPRARGAAGRPFRRSLGAIPTNPGVDVPTTSIGRARVPTFSINLAPEFLLGRFDDDAPISSFLTMPITAIPSAATASRNLKFLYGSKREPLTI